MAIFILLASVGFVVAKGFDEFGYNRDARVFVGTGSSWCEAGGSFPNCLGIYSNDKLKMKWNAEWDRGNAEGWTDSNYDAWLDNNWNGQVPSGSGETWQYKIKWDEGCRDNNIPSTDGGYCIWGQFEVILSHGTVANEHFWDAHAIPTGFGV